MICRCFTNKFVVGALTLASLSLLSMPAWAQKIVWGNPAAVPVSAVPVGGIATIIEGVLLLVMGVYALFRKSGQYKMIAIMVLTAGILTTGIGAHLMIEAYAAAPGVFIISINSASGTANLKHGLNQVHNDFELPVTITKIDPEECVIVVDKAQKMDIAKENDWPTCQKGMQLEPGASCLIDIHCGDIPL